MTSLLRHGATLWLAGVGHCHVIRFKRRTASSFSNDVFKRRETKKPPPPRIPMTSLLRHVAAVGPWSIVTSFVSNEVQPFPSKRRITSSFQTKRTPPPPRLSAVVAKAGEIVQSSKPPETLMWKHIHTHTHIRTHPHTHTHTSHRARTHAHTTLTLSRDS